MKSQFSDLRSQAGFTLIELTIAMTLLALTVMILYGVFYVSHRAVEKSQGRSEDSQMLRSSGELLAGYIRSAYPYRTSPQDPAVFFSGEEDRLEFVSALSSGMGGRGMSRVILSWSGAGDGLLTLQEEIPLRLDDQGTGYRNSVVLRRGVREVRIAYLDSQSEQERWVERWQGDEKRTLPRAVRIALQGYRGEETRWVFPIMMSVLAP
jgi:prepilin-type N-terminal cleavage/methylation domain-containing protein